MKKILTICVIFVLMCEIGVAQNVGINTTGNPPDASAMLDVVATGKGLLIPRMTFANRPASPVTSLLIYQTDAPSGYYYWDGSAWVRLFSGTESNDWTLTGNAGTVVGTNFIGTTDAVDFAIYTNNAERIRIQSGGNVGIGLTIPNDKLEVAGFTRTYGLKTSVMTTGAEMVYIRGTGLNHNANRLVKIGNSTLVNAGGRGLTLTILTASTHSLVSTANYDTYGSGVASDNLATALNNLKRDQIGILTSYDAIEGNITANLRSAARRLGLFKLAVSPGGSRRPYAAIFYGSGTLTGNTEAGRQAIEIFQSNDADAPYAIISTWLIEDGFTGQNLTNALVSGEPNTSEPAVMVNSSGNVGIGTSGPVQKLDVVGDINSSAGYRISNTAASGQYLRGDGTRFVTSAILVGDLPTITAAGGWTDDGVTVRLTTISDNVGIGTTGPNDKLDVSGTTRTTSLALNGGYDASAATGNGQPVFINHEAGDMTFAARSWGMHSGWFWNVYKPSAGIVNGNLYATGNLKYSVNGNAYTMGGAAVSFNANGGPMYISLTSALPNGSGKDTDASWSAHFSFARNGNFSAPGIINATGGNSTNWNTAYGWGDHSTAGYLTSGDNLGNHTATTTLNMAGNDIDMINGQSTRIHSLGEISFDWTAGGSYDNPEYHGIQSKNEAGAWGDEIRINSYNDIINTLDANSNDATSYFKVQHHSSTNGTDLFWVRSADGYAYHSGNVGIGTTGPKTKLEIAHNGASTYGMALRLNQNAIGNSDGPKIEFYKTMTSSKVWTAGILNGVNVDDFAISENGGYASGFGTPRLTVQAGGNVGIGTTGPTEKLDVIGNIRASGTAYWGSSGTRTETKNDAGTMGGRSGYYETSTATTAENWPLSGTWWHLLDVRHSNVTNNYSMQLATSFYDADPDLYFRKTASNAAHAWTKVITAANISGYGDNLGNHTATTTLNMVNFNVDNVNRLEFNDPGDQEGIIWSGSAAKIFVSPLNSGNSDGYLRLINDGGIVFEPGAEDTEVMTLTSGGKVGIGTTGPRADTKLDVSGAVGTSRMGIGGTYNSTQVQGIWSIAPNYKISTASNDFGTQYGITYAHTNAGTVGTKKPIPGWGHQILFTNNGTRNAVISLSSGHGYFAGNVGIGTTGPSQKLHVVGNVRFSGALMPNNSAGTSGQLLVSNGAGVSPTWTGLSGLTNVYEYTSTVSVNDALGGGFDPKILTGCVHTTVAVPAGKTYTYVVLANGTASKTTSSNTRVYAQYMIYVDGVLQNSFQRVAIDDETSGYFDYVGWSISGVYTLGSGVHTIDVRGWHAGATSPDVRLCNATGIVGQATLTVLEFID